MEFVRQSGGENGRITLVILPSAEQVTSLWAEMECADPAAAKEALRLREGKPHRHHIGLWECGHPDPGSLPGLTEWAVSREIDAVVWTDLPPKFQGQDGRVPTHEEVVAYLQALPDEPKAVAIEYIQRAPKQIDTVYRREIARVMPETVAG
ncbi:MULTISPECIES: hypothetical protein [Agrobacterium]|uniref:hypothetical protein n=1 Tax=Agrobacterium TaxID=357 RepID=UPI0027B8C675|nr:hypothetical protein [Agrobacterium sp. SORGH_AS_0745]